ncbi:hypothetical protein LIER_36230 [Lithospermum erythrorhizon]|uniref:Protein kinase domain-containing protein n=1 Tax=Lithospermum erythrorhizon TaxID=34254 RepID=A0AAV3P407_LITER
MDPLERIKIASDVARDQTRTDVGVRGTKGYMAPEWHRKMPVNVKVDVYSFGIVLLEIICCRRNVDRSLPEDEAIQDDEVDIKSLERFVKVGIWCIQDDDE